jgi:entry exclusion lipoprotein TrbK
MIIAKRISSLALVTMLITLISACSTEEPNTATSIAIPEVNDENCMDKNIVKITDKKVREEFAGLCIRRGSFVASPKKTW